MDTAGAIGLSAGGSVLGSVVGGLFNNYAAGQNYKYQLDMWNKQNAYNAPAAQMQRLKDAGLNPNLMYGQGNTGNAAPAQMPQYNLQPPPAPDLGGAVSRGVGMLQTFQNIHNQRVQSDNVQAQTDLVRQNILNAQVDNTIKQGLAYDRQLQNAANSDMAFGGNRYRSGGLLSQLMEAANINVAKARIANLDQQTTLSQTQNEIANFNLNNTMPLQLQNLRSGTSLNMANAANATANANSTNGLFAPRLAGMSLDNANKVLGISLSAKDLDYYTGDKWWSRISSVLPFASGMSGHGVNLYKALK